MTLTLRKSVSNKNRWSSKEKRIWRIGLRLVPPIILERFFRVSNLLAKGQEAGPEDLTMQVQKLKLKQSIAIMMKTILHQKSLKRMMRAKVIKERKKRFLRIVGDLLQGQKPRDYLRNQLELKDQNQKLLQPSNKAPTPRGIFTIFNKYSRRAHNDSEDDIEYRPPYPYQDVRQIFLSYVDYIIRLSKRFKKRSQKMAVQSLNRQQSKSKKQVISTLRRKKLASS